MKHQFSSERFRFVEYAFGQYRYTDNRGGAPMHYLAVLKEGWCRLVSADQELMLYAGDAFYIPQGIPYQSYWHSEDQIRFLSFGFAYFPGENEYALQKLPDDASMLLYSIPLSDAPDAAAIGKLYTALGMLEPRMNRADSSSAKRLVRMATEYMAQNTALSVPEVAQLCYVSESTLYAAFRTAAEMTPNDMRQKLTVEKAVKLLGTTAASVQQISDQLGFSSTDYFRRILKKHTGMSPREIRNAARQV